MFSRKQGKRSWTPLALAFGLLAVAALATSAVMAAKGGKPGKPGDDPVTNPAFTWAPGSVIVMSTDGNTQVIAEGGCSASAWAPDGSKIAFLLADSLYTIRPDGSDMTLVVNFVSNGYPVPVWYKRLSWSPDGTKILYTMPNSPYADLMVLEVSTGAVQALEVGGRYAQTGAFGPDLEATTLGFQGFVAYRASVDPASSPDIHVMRVTTEEDGSLVPDLTSVTVLSMEGTQGFPRWSPDGTKIAFFDRAAAFEAKDLYVVTFDAQTLTFGTPDLIYDVPPETKKGDPRTLGPTWSPDGTWIAFLERIVKAGQDKPGNLYRIHPDGTGLTPFPSSGWIPDWNPAWVDDLD